MPHKHLLFRDEARERILRGTTALTDAVRVTLGPRAKCVLIEKKWGRPLVCNDGVTIAKEIELEDPDENLGARMLREAAERTGEAVGDGTSTATILAHAIFAEGMKNIAAGASAIDLKRGLDRGLKVAVEAIRGTPRRISRGVKTMKSETPIIENHADMHRDHRDWNSEQICWRNDLRSWQHELAKAREDLTQIESALKDHETTLQQHGSAIRLSEQEMDAHEHALTAYEQGGASDELLAMVEQHQQEARLHAEQRAAHERLKRQHHAVVARLRHVLAAFSDALPGAEPAAHRIVT